MERIMFGGSFDPIHLGHVSMVSFLLKQEAVGSVLVVPAACSPFKTGKKLCDGKHRLEMCKIAFEGMENVEISDVEFSLPIPSFTINTLEALKKRYVGQKLGLLIGGDSAMSLCKWKDSGKIIKTAKIYAAVREEADRGKIENELSRLCADYAVISMPKIDISSTIIRERLKNKQSCKGLLPEKVEGYIIENGLYG